MERICSACDFGKLFRRRARDADPEADLAQDAVLAMTRESVRCLAIYLLSVFGYVVVYMCIKFLNPSYNYLPVVSSLMSAFHNSLAFPIWRCTKSPTVFQVAHLISICIDSFVAALCNPVVQPHIGIFLTIFGSVPIARGEVGNVIEFGPDGMMALFIFQGRMLFSFLFILRFRYAQLGLLLSTAIYGGVLHHYVLALTNETFVLALMYHAIIVFVSKLRMDSLQWRLSLELARKQSQVISERVLRFQAEFQNEGYTEADHHLDSKHAKLSSKLSEKSTMTGSSPIMESWPETPSVEDVKLKLRRICDLAIKERWHIDPAEIMLQPDNILGKGSFGVVISGNVQGTPVAVKLAKSICDGSQLRGLPELATEFRVLRRLRHPNIVNFSGACIDVERGNFALVSELIEGPNMYVCLRRSGIDLSAAARCHLFGDVCCALWYMHSRSPCIVHGDLKPSNVLLEQHGGRWRAKLVDFGLSRVLSDHAKPHFGTLLYVAPEIIHSLGKCPVSPLADVFSCGRVGYVVTIGWRPFEEHGVHKVRAILESPLPPPLYWPSSSVLAELCRPTIERCLCTNPRARPDITEIHSEVIRWAATPEVHRSGALASDVPYSKDSPRMEWAAALQHLQDRGKSRRASVTSENRMEWAVQIEPGLSVNSSSLGSLSSEITSSSQDESQNLQGCLRPTIPTLRPTPESVMLRLLQQTASRCYCNLGQDDCCQMHVLANKFAEIIGKLQSGCGQASCSAGVSSTQCSKCGLLKLPCGVTASGGEECCDFGWQVVGCLKKNGCDAEARTTCAPIGAETDHLVAL